MTDNIIAADPFASKDPVIAETLSIYCMLDERDQGRFQSIVRAMDEGRLNLTKQEAETLGRAGIIALADSLAA